MSSAYDEWLATTPEDEKRSANLRKKHQEATEAPAREHGARKEKSRKVYEEDFLYDPSRVRFE